MFLRKRRIHESAIYPHPLFGDVKVVVKANARSIRARWRGPNLRVSVPPGITVDEYERFLTRYEDRISDMRPVASYSLDMVVDTPEADFSICRGWEESHGAMFLTSVEKSPVRGKRKNYYIHVAPSACGNIHEPQMQEYINNLMLWAARDATVRFVLPRAKELAARVGQKPLGWSVKEFKTRLGTCTSGGIITLSSRLIFLPPELRDFIVYHELAHLSEMNHSSAFHEVCDRYCGGREAELSRRLKKFRFPVF